MRPIRLAGAAVGAIVALFVIIGAGAWVFSFHGTDPGHVCVVQEGGPFDGRDISQVRQPSQGPKPIGAFNHQRCYPSTQRNYIVSADPTESDKQGVDFVEVPTKDAVTVRVEGQALFTLNTDPKVVADFYRKYGVRTFNGLRPDQGDDGWSAFLAVQFRPVLDNALREAIGSFDCIQLNNTCQYIQNPDAAVQTGKVQAVDNTQNIAAAQQRIEQTLQDDLDTTLGGPFLEGLRFRLRGIRFPETVQREIEAAQAKRTQVANAKLDAQRREQQAEGDRLVAEKQAAAIRLKAKSYRENPAQAQIDKLKALCGPSGCQNLQVIGGSVTKLIGNK